MATRERQSPSARWVCKQLDMRGIPYFPPIKVHQAEQGSLQALWGLRWYATDVRRVEIAGSESSIAELKRAPGIIANWPGYGIVRLLPG